MRTIEFELTKIPPEKKSTPTSSHCIRLLPYVPACDCIRLLPIVPACFLKTENKKQDFDAKQDLKQDFVSKVLFFGRLAGLFFTSLFTSLNGPEREVKKLRENAPSKGPKAARR